MITKTKTKTKKHKNNNNNNNNNNNHFVLAVFVSGAIYVPLFFDVPAHT